MQYSKSVQEGFHDIMDRLPEQEIDCAKESLIKTEQIVYDIKTFIKDADDSIDGFKGALRQTYYSSENKEGQLTTNPSFYDALINIKV